MKYHAFISFSSRHRAWARLLHRNLTCCLGNANIFLDEAGIGPGRSWVSSVQQGIDSAARVVLVASPEAFASSWVRHELESFQALHPDWKAKGLLQVVLLVDTPLPPFLYSAQHIDFRDHDNHTYMEGLKNLVAVLSDLYESDNLSPLPNDLVVPTPPSGGLPTELRSRLVRILSKVVRPRYGRTTLAAGLGLSLDSLEDHASAPLAASAALILASGLDAADKARRVIDVVVGQELVDGDTALIEELGNVQIELVNLNAMPASLKALPAPTGRVLPKPNDLVHPTGTVPLGSELYVERESDKTARKAMDQMPGLVHIIGPNQMGKSSLITRLADRASNDPAGPLVVSINFQDLDGDTLVDLRSLLVQFSWQVLEAAGRDPELVREIESTLLSTKLACKRLIQREVLEHHPQGVFVALDETDRVVKRGGCADDFFSMLRAWHETGKKEEVWSGLRLALTNSTEASMTPEGTMESPLSNVGVKCRLCDFTELEISDLARLHGLEASQTIAGRIRRSLGGNPYLTRRTLYALAAEDYEIERVVSEALAGKGPLGGHLSHHLRRLQASSELAAAMRQVLRQGECPDEQNHRILEGLGLVRHDSTRVMPRYPIYEAFLRDRL